MPSAPSPASEPDETPMSKARSTVAAGQPPSWVTESPTLASVIWVGTAAATSGSAPRSAAIRGLAPP